MHTATEVTINVTLPQALLFDSGLASQEAGSALLRAYVLSLYRRDRISSGRAARLLGVDRLTLIRLLAEEDIPFLDYTTDELDAEMAVMRQWREE